MLYSRIGSTIDEGESDMKKDEFDRIVAEAEAKHPLWFQLDRDPPATLDKIVQAERNLGGRLPDEYRDFLLAHGAGHFAFALILGVETGSEWNIVQHKSALPVDFVPVSDTGTGDYFGFVVRNGRCDRPVAFWDHETGSVQESAFPDFYEMLLARALTP